ncbi:MAG: nucleoside recognition domain-containing protein [Flavobacteriales bacterium]|nr:nucleoside recognition domain-containing protein [Flavobacteriales bacterium]
MVLNYIWISFFIIAFIVALYKTVFNQNPDVFSEMISSTFDMADVSFEIAIGLTGILCLWLGIMNIGEKGGAVQLLSRLVGPFFNKLFPDIPANHPARGSMMMNFSANMLGLDNAATPMGLKAMNELQELNEKKDTASNSMIMFLVLNTSGLTLIPITVMNYRDQFGAENPADIFIPILLATFFASIVGLITVAIYQKINIFNKVILAYLGGICLIIASAIYYFSQLTPKELEVQSSLLSSIILYGIICLFILLAVRKKINVYEAFIEGAKDGFNIAIKIIPYLVAIIVSIGVFRASGAMELFIGAIASFFSLFTENTEFVDALPTAFMKPLSGSGARGLMLDSFQHFGVDSFVGKLTSTLQGATDTTFYIIAVYFGAVSIRKTRYAITAGLIADLAGIIAAIFIAYLFFGSTTNKINNDQVIAKFAYSTTSNNMNDCSEILSESICMYDLQMDTITLIKSDFIDKFPLQNNLKLKSYSEIKQDIEVTKERIYLLKFTNKQNANNYKIHIKNGEITIVEYLGFFKRKTNYINDNINL